MSWHLFCSAVLLLVLVMMCCGSEAATAVEEQSSDPQFEWKDVNPEDVTVESLGAPGLLKVGSDVFAVAEAQCKKDEKKNVFTGVASQLLTERWDNTPEEVLNNPKDKTHFLQEGTSSSSKKLDVSRPTTVVKESDIYMLVGKYSRTAATCGAPGSRAADSGLLLVKGEVSGEESGSEKRIQWNENQRLAGTFSADEHKCLTQLIGGGGSGVKMNDGTLVFPVEATKKQNEDGNTKTVSLILYSKDTNTNWKLSKGMSADGCSVPSVVEWKDGKLMMMTACDDGRRRVYESAEKGTTWTEALGTLSRVWGNKKVENVKFARSGFITAKIEDRDVMLVTLPVYAKTESEEKEKEKEKGELHLWLTDNTHIADIGPVSGDDDDAAASSLLYKSGGNNELIALYEKKGGGDTPSPGMVSVPLTAQLQRVKEVLKTWKEVDSRVSQLRNPSESALQDPSADTACTTDKITAGLVGFLSGSFSEDTWKDEYLGVDATITGVAKATKTSDGVTFHGAWAEWPVGAQGQNQLYHFANYNFTLLATVSIDKVPEGDTIPLMGVQMNDAGKTVLLGLSYNSEKKWRVLCSDGTTKQLKRNWERETQYQVAIVMQNGSQSTAYVDGQRVCRNVQRNFENTESKGISHFYIGGDGRSAGSREDISVTVTNVLLYNRPWDDNEMTALNTIKLSISQTAKEGETDEGAALDGGAHGDASNHCGNGLLPSLLLLLGLWWFAAL
ncbi:trans-sialidase [Trypanosoma cruzi Dm28c]|uniref:Trans-sialidase n=2 Tax=Trypanosoma cruzi TaxID=5693 RepID=V5CZN4_TRYCR|nr:trans-sialidase [Trypanosoma cruzi Dm28c]